MHQKVRRQVNAPLLRLTARRPAVIPEIIGITGAAGCGKDTLAMMIGEEFGHKICSVAAPIKEGLNAMFGWKPAQWENRLWKETPIAALGASPRVLAQTLGTDWGRTVAGPGLWINALLSRHFDGKPGARVVIPDVRFDNEAEKIIERGGVVVHLHRPGLKSVAAHASENGVSPHLVYFRIVNDDTPAMMLTWLKKGLQQWV